MKVHSSRFKELMKQPRQATRELTKNGVALNLDLVKGLKYNANVDFLKSLMKNLEITTSETLQKNDIINFKYIVDVDGTNESLNYGNFVVYEIEEQEDTGDFKVTCYDKMLYSMIPYEGIDKEFPLTVREYIGGICEKIGLNFASANTTFTNYDKIINEDLYIGYSYTYRDVLDEFSQATASMICVNENDEIEVRDINETNDVIDEDFMNDVNITLKERYGAINSVVLSRSAGSDNIFLKDDDSIAVNGLTELKISDNQIMNFNDRDTYLQEIFNKLNGLYFYLNDFESKGICYYDIFDKYTIRLRGVDYPCLMLNDEIDFGVGTHEKIYTDKIENSVTDYTKADSTDKRVNKAFIIVDKQLKRIESQVSEVVNVSATVRGNGSVTLKGAYEGALKRLSISGNISLLFPSNNLFPSNDLFSKDTILIIDEKEYKLDFDYLSYYNSTIYDEFICDNGECYIVRRVGIDENGNKYVLDKEIIEPRKGIFLNVKSNSTIRLKSFENAIFEATYLLRNDYTTTFANQVEVRSMIEQTSNSLNLEVSKKLDEGEFTGANIILEINKEGSEAQISADKINLKGKEINLTGDDINIESDNFKVSKDGKISSKAGNIGGWNIEGNKLWCFITPPDDYFEEDINIIQKILLNEITPTEEQFKKYDINKDGVINASDLLSCKKLVMYGMNKSNPAQLVFDTSDWFNPIKLINSKNEVLVSLGVSGLFTKEVE